MNITTVSYAKLFPLGAFINEKIGVEISISEGEDARFALSEAKKLVHEFHFEQNKELYEMKGTTVTTIEPELVGELAIINDIKSCKELKVLESYRLIVKNNPELQEAYDNKLKELQP
jgi:uncharacterized cupredoxin-like copper-binding protein